MRLSHLLRFNYLPRQFTFKDAKLAYGKRDNPTRQWLKKCEAAGLVRQEDRGKYEKVAAIATRESGEVAEGREEVSRPVGDSPSVPTEEGLKEWGLRVKNDCQDYLSALQSGLAYFSGG